MLIKRTMLLTVWTLLVLVVVWAGQNLFPFRLGYFLGGDVLYCTTIWSCEHEVGHEMDYDLGGPSADPKFMETVHYYVITQLMLDPANADMAIGIEFSNLESSQETYALLYDMVDGNIGLLPVALQPYYSTDPKYKDKLACLSGDYTHTCGKSLRLGGWGNTQPAYHTPSLAMPSR